MKISDNIAKGMLNLHILK